MRRRYKLVGVVVAALLVVAFVRQVRNAREQARESVCNAHLYKMVFAMRLYHEQHGRLPPPYVVDEAGTPMHSWRVLLLPYLGYDELYSQYNFEEPWNGPNNSKLKNKMPDIYRCPNLGTVNSSQTSYFVVVGAGTAFPANRNVGIENFAGATDAELMITDDPTTTALVIESATRTTNWLEPNDLLLQDLLGDGEFERMLDECPDPAGIGVVFVDGKYFRISARTSAKDLRSMWTIQGGEFLNRASLQQ